MVMTPAEEVVEEAVVLARRWAESTTSQQTPAERRTSGRLARLVANPAGLDLAVRFVDRVARPEDQEVAARELAALAGAAGSASFLSPADKVLLGVGSRIATRAPTIVVPLALARLRQLVGHLVVDAEDPALAKHLAAARAEGFRLNLNLLGEAVLGENEAAARAERTRRLLERDDVDYVSIKVSSLVSQISTWDTVGTTARVLDRLRPIYRTAAAANPQKFVNLDMEEYRDLELTLDVFEAMLSEPEFAELEAGIVLQAYLPDTPAALERLIAFAQQRHEQGGGRIKIRLVKGANLAMERVEAELHGWPQAPYPTKDEVDANYLRLLERALRPEVCESVRLGVASHNLFDVAFASLLATRRGVAAAMDVEMLQGMAPSQARAVRADVGHTSPVILYTPVVARADFDVAVSYLVRRLEENAAPENFLHALFAGGDGDRMADQERRFRRSVAAYATTARGPRRTAHRPAITESFANTPDSDPAVAEVRDRAADLVVAYPGAPTSPVLADEAAVDGVVSRALVVQPGWSIRSGRDRARTLRAAAAALERARGDLVTAMAAEGGKTIGEADPEVSEAVDFARYYADAAERLDDVALADGLEHQPDRVVLVTPPWNFPVAIPTGGVLAALAAGSAVVIKPAPATPRCTEIAVEAVREALTETGAEADLVQVVRTDEGEVGRALVAHEHVDTVILTGAYETARMFTRWRADRPHGPRVYGETSGKNALIVTPSADYDLAVADAVRSAFGHAGQKCSAASLLILVGSVGSSERFRRQLTDAVSSLRVGWPSDLGSGMGPVIEQPQGKLAEALTTLGPGEVWAVEPRRLDETGRLWSPGLRAGVQPGSPFHLTEYFGPVLGIMVAADLDEAIAWQNAGAYGLTGGLHSLDEREIAHWLSAVEVGNAYVNRHTTGAIVQRQSFGGWKRSAVGPGAKAGGPNYVAQLGSWSQVGSPTTVGEIGPRVAAILDAAHRWVTRAEHSWLREAAGSDAHARGLYSVEIDRSGLRAEANIFRYRPMPNLQVRGSADAGIAPLLRVLLAAECAGVPTQVSISPELALPEQMAAWARAQEWVIESDDELGERIARGEIRGRVRVVGNAAGIWPAALQADADVTILQGPVLASGRRELLTVLREQAISRTMHRFGHLSAR
ncbi:bifunctional proline dehydrogenase/L-glutamate gamma-semialdehyde dehydrogenase [Pseudactinotalea terrae]|uniref:bifunctional proline dehydrogenase/L-glutamate gamma-semialdehyde dehydrogenase n=1 Tax=Pseudactinotalea terrae TaxID=1743262 RepID=UPI0012E32955|nr:bifunctional proline dehydrogenase/L-glutamate gamma-semialdehyde dehydrogenase [Pseudactinotalea terrae]